jgi:O-succinylbenzoic acid--CoA ligase
MFNLSFSSNYSNPTLIEDFIEKVINGEPIELKTSGSTGNPKRLIYPVSLLKTSARKTNSFFHFNENTKALLCMNTETIAGKMMLIRALEGRFSIYAINPTKRPLECVHSKIDFVAMVPLQLRESLIHDVEKLKHIRTILIGGGPIPLDLENLLHENELTVYHSFGMTETVSHIALKKVGKETEKNFQALNGVHFSLENGQLVIHARDLGIDYLVTNDLVNLITPTSFQWLGRKDFVINSGGYKLNPEILENSWSTFLNLPFFIWKEPSEKWGEKMVFYIEANEWPEISRNKLSSLFKTHELPKAYYLSQSFVYTSSGKIDRLKTVKLTSNISRGETF